MKTLGSYLLIAAAGICWGMTGFCNRFITPLGFSQSQIMFVRCIVPLVALGVYLVLCNREALRIKLKDLWVFLGSGLLSLTMFGLAYMNAMQVMSLSAAVVLLYTSPIFVVLISAVLFREKITRGKVIALACVIIGALFTTGLITGADVLSPLGIVLGLVSGLGYALYSIFSRLAFQRGYGSMTVTFYTFLFSTIAVGLICKPWEIIGLIDGPQTFSWLLLFGILTSLAPYLLYTKGLENVENGKASIVASIEMVVATAMSALFFHEPFGIQNLVGIVLVFIGIFVVNWGSGPREDGEPPAGAGGITTDAF